MGGFRYAYSLNGHKTPIMQEFYIPAATAIELGEPFSFTQGTGVIAFAEHADFDDPITAVAAEAHDGATAGRQSGTWIKGIIDPDAVYRWDCTKKTYTTTGGSTTTVVDDSLVPTTDNFWIGGAVKIVNCVANPNLNGRIVPISDSTGAGGTLTLGETLPSAIAAGDTYQLCPGYMAKGYIGFDLDSDAMNPNWDAIGGTNLILVDSDPMTMTAFFKFRLNEFASQAAAI